MVRQYVGARYVPKFSDLNGGVWDNSYTYEGLTIVRYGNDYYTSRKPVPTGIAITNTEYWVLTGDYGGAIAELHGEIDGVSDRVTTNANNISTLNTTVAGHTTQIGALNTETTRIDNNKVNKISNRKFLFVGDSYIASHTNTCVEIACSALGITNFENIGVSGKSFSDNGFLTQVSTYSGNKDSITDIFVIGGLNDSIYSSLNATLKDAINDFFSYVHTHYINAHVTVCFAGHALDDAPLLGNRTWLNRTYAKYMYRENVLNNGGTYYGDMWEGLAVNKDHMNSDHLHPNSTGNRVLGGHLVSYILGSSADTVYPCYKFNADGTELHLNYTVNNGNVLVTLDSGCLIINMASRTINGSANIAITTNARMYANKKFTIPCLCRADNCNSLSYQNLRGYLVFDGFNLSLKLNELDASAFKTYAFASNGSIAIETIAVNIPLENYL